MRRLLCISLLVPMLLVFAFCADATAKGGRGGGPKGGGVKGGNGRGGGGPPQFRKDFRPGSSPSRAQDAVRSRGDHPREMQRIVEERKLAHRRRVADHLREIGDRNGNEHLNDVADRMERKAEEHYEKRLARIDGKEASNEHVADSTVSHERAAGINDPDVNADPPINTDRRTTTGGDEIGKLTGRENAFYRQLRNEERKLAHRLETAEQLRNLAELNGDEQLLAAVERLEETALSHYERRLTQIAEFGDRFGVQKVSDAVAPK